MFFKIKKSTKREDPNLKRYRFQGREFFQTELTFGEDMKVRAILKDALITVDERQSVMAALDALIDKGCLPDLFGVILKPYKPRFTFVRLLGSSPIYRLRMSSPGERDARISRAVVENLTNSEIVQVLNDFFYLNTSWLGSALGSLLNSLSLQPTGMAGTISDLRNFFTKPQGETSRRPTA